jgi:predicted kinase
MSAKPTLVLMAGLPGAGKSTLASALGRKMNCHVIDKDKHKEGLLKQGMDEETAGIEAYEWSFRTARSRLTIQRESVILDTAALHHFILDNALEIVRNVPNAQLKVVLCVVDRDLRNERLRNRPWRDATIRVNPATTEDYLKYFEHLPSDRLTLDTIDPFEKCLALAENYLLSLSCHRSESNGSFHEPTEAYIKR